MSRAVLSMLLLVVVAAAPLNAAATLVEPDPELAPEEVLDIVLRALAEPDEPHAGVGIEQVWAFASPLNRTQTGPLERFRELIRNRLYRPLLGHVNSHRREWRVEGGQAYAEVEVVAADGARVIYAFQFRRYGTDDCAQCWLTDSVVPLSREEFEAI